MKVNWPMVIASVIAGVVVLIISEYGFKRTVDADGTVKPKLFFQD